MKCFLTFDLPCIIGIIVVGLIIALVFFAFVLLRFGCIAFQNKDKMHIKTKSSKEKAERKEKREIKKQDAIKYKLTQHEADPQDPYSEDESVSESESLASELDDPDSRQGEN